MRIIYNKLVRDRIPDIIKAEGHACSIRELSDVDYLAELKRKLVEEAHEAKEAPNAAALSVELADLLEVMHSLAKALGITWDTVKSVKRTRCMERGGFAGKLYLDYVDKRDT